MSGRPGFLTAERKGREAFAEGKTRMDFPYRDGRTARGSITWSRAYIRAWQRGWDEAAKDLRPLS